MDSGLTFIGTAPCGCIVALASADTPDLPAVLADWEQTGLTRTTMPTAEVRSAPWKFGHYCLEYAPQEQARMFGEEARRG